MTELIINTSNDENNKKEENINKETVTSPNDNNR